MPCHSSTDTLNDLKASLSRDPEIEVETRCPSLGDLLTARPQGLSESEAWAVLCQAVQALQDLLLSDDDSTSSYATIPLITPRYLLLSERGRVVLKTSQRDSVYDEPPPHLSRYLAPEYRRSKKCSDTEAEKMWIYGLGETIKRVTLTSHAATSRLSVELCQALTDMTRFPSHSRASLMHLLNVISDYCKTRQQTKPFSHTVMDLYQEAMAGIETLEPWGLPSMPQIEPRVTKRIENVEVPRLLPRRWMKFPKRKITREASTSMENLSQIECLDIPGSMLRPKSVCVPDYLFSNASRRDEKFDFCVCDPPCKIFCARGWRWSGKVDEKNVIPEEDQRNGPEFEIGSKMPSKKYVLPDHKGHCTKTVTVVLLSGQKLDVLCNPNNSTIGNLFELVIQKEHIEENFMLGLSVPLGGDHVFLPSDTKISKAPSESSSSGTVFYLRIRFFLPSLRGIKSSPARHLLYLQLRRLILEDQLPCTFSQLVNLEGLALQAEFGDFREDKYKTTSYIPLEHYVPVSMLSKGDHFRGELVKSHKKNVGLSQEKAEEEFISSCQKLGNYGGHFYKATWMLKNNKNKDVWLFICAQGISLYERGLSLARKGYNMYVSFEWKNIQTLCYSKRYLCLLPHESLSQNYDCKKYKLKMDNKKSYFTFRLASLHHQFFLRLRTQYTSLHSLSQQFGIPLKDAKMESDSLKPIDEFNGSVNASREFNIAEFNHEHSTPVKNKCQRSQSVCTMKEKTNKSLSCANLDSSTLDSKWYSKLDSRRRGVKMGIRAINNNNISLSLEAVNTLEDNGYLTPMKYHSTLQLKGEQPFSDIDKNTEKAFVIDSTSTNSFYHDLQETLSESLLEKLNAISFVEERALSTATVYRDGTGSLGIRITEGSDGNVYIQSIIAGSSAYFTGKICAGDQIISVNGKNLIGLKYQDALNVLKATGDKNEFVISRVVPKEKSCRKDDFSSMQNLKFLSNYFENLEKCVGDKEPIKNKDVEKYFKRDEGQEGEVSYHKHIRYDFNFENESPVSSRSKNGKIESISSTLNRDFPKQLRQQLSLQEVPENEEISARSYHSLDRDLLFRLKLEKRGVVPPVAVPRSLGLGRKWKGPVRYPVTPIKKVHGPLSEE